jgi:transposase
MLERTLYGTRSERLHSDKPEQIAFVFDEIATGVAAIEAELIKAGGKDKPQRAPRPRKEFGAHLERLEIVIEPDVPPGWEGLEKVLIGQDVSRRLDVTPAKFRLIVTRRPKYAYRNRDGVVQARHRSIWSRAAFRLKRFSPTSRWPNTPTACRCIGTKRSTRVTVSISSDH